MFFEKNWGVLLCFVYSEFGNILNFWRLREKLNFEHDIISLQKTIYSYHL